MEFIRKILSILSAEMTEPQSYRWFHLMFVAIMIGLTVFLCIKFRNTNDKTFRRIVLICWITMVILELYKQFEYSYSLDTPTIEWDYQWYAFPYQLCSTPLYALPFIAFMKDCKFRDAIIAYMATFSIFGGLATFCYPEQVFISTIGINIQTMVHHGLQIVLGVYFISYVRKKFSIKYYLWGIPVFASFMALAIIVNELYVMILGTGETFNMFYVSRHFECTLPILDGIYEEVTYIPFLLIYIFGFVLISAIIYFTSKLILFIIHKVKDKKQHA